MSQHTPPPQRPLAASTHLRTDQLSEIDSLYRTQIQQIYSDSQGRTATRPSQPARTPFELDPRPTCSKAESVLRPTALFPGKQLQSAKSASTFNLPGSQSSSKMFNSGCESEDKVRASMFLRGESAWTVEMLRRENESKELKVRQLSSKCQHLVQKLRKQLPPEEFESEMRSLRQSSDSKLERLEQLFKIKQEEIFFKIKLQASALLQDFGVSPDGLAELRQVAEESHLFSLMSRQLKSRLKDFRAREQESGFQMQKDRIVGQKQEEHIHFLTETNQLLKLSQVKLKAKIEGLKLQLNDYLDKLRARERENQENESQLFRFRNQHQEHQAANLKLNAALKSANTDRLDDRRLFDSKEKEMKSLLNSYFIEKKKSQSELEELEGEIEQLQIRLKFGEQQNQRLNRELVRWKERYEWLQKDKESRYKDIVEQKDSVVKVFEEYKVENNQSIILGYRGDIEEALMKVEEYQREYQRVVLELEHETRLLERSEEQGQERLMLLETEWLNRVKRLESIKEEQLNQISHDFDMRVSSMRQAFERKEKLLSEEMRARLKALLAEKDKQATEQLIELEDENNQLRREVGTLGKVVEVKQSLISVVKRQKMMGRQ